MSSARCKQLRQIGSTDVAHHRARRTLTGHLERLVDDVCQVRMPIIVADLIGLEDLHRRFAANVTESPRSSTRPPERSALRRSSWPRWGRRPISMLTQQSGRPPPTDRCVGIFRQRAASDRARPDAGPDQTPRHLQPRPCAQPVRHARLRGSRASLTWRNGEGE